MLCREHHESSIRDSGEINIAALARAKERSREMASRAPAALAGNREAFNRYMDLFRTPYLQEADVPTP